MYYKSQEDWYCCDGKRPGRKNWALMVASLKISEVDVNNVKFLLSISWEYSTIVFQIPVYQAPQE